MILSPHFRNAKCTVVLCAMSFHPRQDFGLVCVPERTLVNWLIHLCMSIAEPRQRSLPRLVKAGTLKLALVDSLVRCTSFKNICINLKRPVLLVVSLVAVIRRALSIGDVWPGETE